MKHQNFLLIYFFNDKKNIQFKGFSWTDFFGKNEPNKDLPVASTVNQPQP